MMMMGPGTGEISGIFHGLGNFWVYLMGYAKAAAAAQSVFNSSKIRLLERGVSSCMRGVGAIAGKDTNCIPGCRC